MSKTVEERAKEFASNKCRCSTCILEDGCPRNDKDGIGCDRYNKYCRIYIESATEQKSIDDEEYRKDMRYVGVKREELIDNVLDTTIQYLQDHLIDVVLVGEDKQSGACGYRILDERIKKEVKKRLK